jgi:hypothetical protein
MASTTFVDNQTIIMASWMNDANTTVYSTVPANTAAISAETIRATTAEGVATTAIAAEGVTRAAADSLLRSLTNDSFTSINSGQIGGFRNRIINGDMQVSQVNGTTAVTPATNGTYPLDQWQYTCSLGSKLTFQQVVDAPAGFKYSTKITVASQYSPAVGDAFLYKQPIEGQNIVDFQLGTAGAVTLATSNYIKGSVAGVYAVSVVNGASNRSYVGTINVTTAWSKVVITLVGDTTGTWATDNTAGLFWQLDLGSGTNYNTTANTWQAGFFLRTAGSVSFVNQVAGSTLNITGVQLTQVSPGATSDTSFEHVPYATQLSWCQRYQILLENIIVDTGTSIFSTILPVKMRAQPTWSGGGAGFAANGFTNGQSGYLSQTTRGTQQLVVTSQM